MRTLLLAIAIAIAFASALDPLVAAAQQDERFRITHRYMRDGVGQPVGLVFLATNLTDEEICIRPVVRRRDNVDRTTPNELTRLSPRQRNVRLINFFIRNTQREGRAGVTAVEEPCPTPA